MARWGCPVSVPETGPGEARVRETCPGGTRCAGGARVREVRQGSECTRGNCEKAGPEWKIRAQAGPVKRCARAGPERKYVPCRG